MNITFWLNGVKRQAEVRPDELLLDFLRKNSCYSVKRGCETANCGLCTVLMDERPVLSCSMLGCPCRWETDRDSGGNAGGSKGIRSFHGQ